MCVLPLTAVVLAILAAARGRAVETNAEGRYSSESDGGSDAVTALLPILVVSFCLVFLG